MRPEKRIMPNTAAKESWSPVFLAENGFRSKSRDSAKDNDVSGSFSLLTKGAKSMTVCMIPALADDGVFPDINTNSHMIISVMTDPFLSFPKTSRQNPAIKEICIPVQGFGLLFLCIIARYWIYSENRYALL